MTPDIKRYILSSINTFLSTFLVTLGSLVLTVDMEHITLSITASLVLSAVNTGVRAMLKTYFDNFR